MTTLLPLSTPHARMLRTASITSLLLAAAAQDCSVHPLLNPTVCCTKTSPKAWNATFVTSVGAFTVYVERAWSPLGADRFFNLIDYHYFDTVTEGTGNAAGMFRVVPNFVTQYGIAGEPAVSAAWANLVIDNDPVILSNIRGTLAYAAVQDANGNACNRTTQVYINLGDNSQLDALGFTPIGSITPADMKIVDAIYAGYGQNPDQDLIYSQGDSYLLTNFPDMTFVRNTTWTLA